jgi:hypothetical protein
MSREQAIAEFRLLVARYGLQWTPARVPDKSAWERMEQVQRHLTTEDRRTRWAAIYVEPS